MSVLNVSEGTSKLRIVLSEYGKPVATESLKSGEVTSEDGIVSWKRQDTTKQAKPDWTEKDYGTAKALQSVTGIEVDALRNGNLRIKGNALVGHIAFENFDLVILPKFVPLRTTDGKESPLATLLLYAYNFEHLKDKIVGEQRSLDTLFSEILIHCLCEEIHAIQRRGLFRHYRQERRDLSVIRGKIDIKTWLLRGGIPSETMPCVFYRRSLDSILNQTLCAGLRRSVAITKSPELKSQCRFLADTFALDGVTDRSLDCRMLAGARRGLNRLNAHYENAIRIVQMLYEGSGGFVFGDPHQGQVRIPGFFFDMNKLFEIVIGKFLKDNLPREYGIGLQNQNVRNVFFYEQRKPPVIKPDIIVSKNGGAELFVLDTKYKDIGKELDENIEIGKGNPSTADLYQLSVYALTCSKPIPQARIIYPGKDNILRRIALHPSADVGGNDLCEITLKPIDMKKLAKTIDGNSDKEKQDLACEIIGEQPGSDNTIPETQNA